MATKKKSSKKSLKKSRMSAKKSKAKKITRKKSAKQTKRPRKAAAKKRSAKSTAAQKSTKQGSSQSAKKKQSRKPSTLSLSVQHPAERGVPRYGAQSGDLQGLSRRESANSESVDELLEEGNAFEADAVSGVENADNSDGREVHTHEVPEDDVPEEYLDEK